MYNFGYIKSELDGTEERYKTSSVIELPKEYSYVNDLPPVMNQGNNPICVTCSCAAYLNWKIGMEKAKAVDAGVKVFEIYNSKTNPGDGMTYKGAFDFLIRKGVNSNEGLLKIGGYALVKGPKHLKSALIENGPCFGALMVYGNRYGEIDTEFWKKSDRCMGGHAISIVGYTEEGFIIRNSWGKGFGKDGYVLLKNSDFGDFLEIWTVIK